MTTTVDEIMALDPLNMTANDINVIIGYHRNNRARSIDGKKPSAPTDKPKLDVGKLLGKAPAKSTGVRRI